MKIIANKIKCNKCGEVIESKTVHDFKFCKCGTVAVEGGHLRLKLVNEEYKEDKNA